MKYAYIERHPQLPRWEAWTYQGNYALTVLSHEDRTTLKERVEKLGFLVCSKCFRKVPGGLYATIEQAELVGISDATMMQARDGLRLELHGNSMDSHEIDRT
jgi:hypothetical protein